MKPLGWIIGVCVALALVSAAAQLAGLVIVALLILGLVLNPRETFGVLAGLVLLGLMANHPLVGLPLLLAIMVSAIRQQGRE